jgi:YVTN family beta-propeller protein
VAYAYRVVDTIEIGATIDDMTLLPNTTTAYAISGTFGRLLVFDTQTGSVRTAAEFLGGPTGICALRNGAFVYVSCSNTSDVLAVRTFDDTIVARVRVSIPDDGGVAAAIDDSKVYAASLGARICVIRTVDNLVVDSIYPGHPPRRLAVSPDGQHLYVSTGTNNVLAIRLSDYSVVATVPVGEDPVGMAVSPDGKRVYVANRNSNSVSVIRTEDNVVEATITSVGRWVDYLSLSPDGRYLYASGESLWVIRTSDFSLVPLAVEFGYTAASLVTPDGCVYVYGRIPSGHDAIYKLGF